VSDVARGQLPGALTLRCPCLPRRYIRVSTFPFFMISQRRAQQGSTKSWAEQASTKSWVWSVGVLDRLRWVCAWRVRGCPVGVPTVQLLAQALFVLVCDLSFCRWAPGWLFTPGVGQSGCARREQIIPNAPYRRGLLSEALAISSCIQWPCNWLSVDLQLSIRECFGGAGASVS
jgi:hypothetical protein